MEVLLTVQQKLVVQNSVHRLQEQGGDGQVAHFLLLKLPVDLRKSRVLRQRVLQLLQDERVCVDVLEVIVCRDGVKVSEDDVADALVLARLRRVATALPEK